MGFSRLIIVVDAVALLVCLLDLLRFPSDFHTIGDAFNFAADAVRQRQLLDSPIVVFGFLMIVLPVLMTLLPRAWKERKPKPPSKRTASHGTSNRNGASQFERPANRTLLFFSAHFLASSILGLFTLLGMSMETLSGWSKGEAVAYSFTSYWVAAILWIKPFYSGLLLPVLKKFVVRTAGREHAHFSEVLREVATEDRLHGGE
jgi:hypothetical protein